MTCVYPWQMACLTSHDQVFTVLFTKSEQSLVSPLDLMNIKEFKNTI
jgi:hypothetical protein